jgi:hypothetical protein
LIERKPAADFAQSLIDGRLLVKPSGWRLPICDQPILLREQARNGPYLASRERPCKEPWLPSCSYLIYLPSGRQSRPNPLA